MAVANVSNDYSNYCDVNIKNRLEPINKSVDDMLTRLEEFQTMISFVHQDRDESNKILISVLDATDDFNDLCKKIDKIECLVAHIKNNLNALDEEISKTEENLGCLEQSTLKMPSIFTPLFKKTNPSTSDCKDLQLEKLETFKTEDYFN